MVLATWMSFQYPSLERQSQLHPKQDTNLVRIVGKERRHHSLLLHVCNELPSIAG